VLRPQFTHGGRGYERHMMDGAMRGTWWAGLERQGSPPPPGDSQAAEQECQLSSAAKEEENSHHSSLN